ncbi:MAG: cell wall metabolism sensor histidine kinase WalK, partial [Cyanobacteria bacterium]|nr:cell wall metabolism sensor histidine kinase WalK [Cyanobacteriota bacterium]
MQIKITHKGLFIVFVPLVLELVFVGIMAYLVFYAETLIAAESRSKDVIATTESVSARLRDAGRSLALFGMHRMKKDAEAFDLDIQESKIKLARLPGLIAREREQLQALKLLQRSVSVSISTMNRIRRAFDAREILELADINMRLNPSYRDMSVAATRIIDYESKMTKYIDDKLKASKQQVYLCLIIGIAANIGLCVALAVYFTKDITRRISVIVDNTTRLQSGQSNLVHVDGTDEIALLGRRFDSMAEALEDAAHKERAIVDRALDSIFSLDTSLRFKRVNPAAHALIGYGRDELEGQRIGSVIHKEDVEKATESISQCRDHPGGSAQLECRLMHKDGTVRWIELSVYWSAVDESYFCVAHDTTERKKIEQLKRDFVSMISHDLRTPLTAVSAFLELLENGAYGQLQGKGMTTTKKIQFNVDYLINMISNLLDVEKMETGKIELEWEDVSVQKVVSTAVSLVEEYARVDDINLELLSGEDTVIVYGDEHKLVRVIQNLVSNAIKYSKASSTVT